MLDPEYLRKALESLDGLCICCGRPNDREGFFCLECEAHRDSSEHHPPLPPWDQTYYYQYKLACPLSADFGREDEDDWCGCAGVPQKEPKKKKRKKRGRFAQESLLDRVTVETEGSEHW